MKRNGISKLVLSAACSLALVSGCGGDDPGTYATRTQSTALSASGATTSELVVTAENSSVTLAAGTQLLGAGDAVIGGNTASVALAYANHERFLPGRAGELPEHRSLAAFVDLQVSASGQSARALSAPARVALDLAQTGVTAGDAVSLYRYDGNAWGATAEGVRIVGADNAVSFDVAQPALWAALRPSAALFRSSAFLGDMSALTRSYIPPLLYTNLPAVNTTQAVCADAQKALTRLTTVWSEFKGRYRSSTEFAAHGARFDDIDAHIAQAGSIIAAAITAGGASNDLLAAHEALEVIRDHMLEMDRANGLDYPIDVIKEFHDAMEPFALAVKGTTAATLTDADIITLRALWTPVETSWNHVVAYQINAAHFGLSTEVKAFIDTATANQTTNLRALKAALLATTLTATEKGVVAANGNKVKPLFLNLFFSFADFIKPFDADLLAADQSAAAAVLATAKAAANADELAAAVAAVNALEAGFNRFKAHFATQPMSIMGVLTWNTGSPTTPGYFDKIGAAIAAAKTQLGALQAGGAGPFDLTAVNAQAQVYGVEMAKLRARMSYP